MEPRTLLITPSYIPHQIVRGERAVTMLFQGKIDAIEVLHEGSEFGAVPYARLREFPKLCKAYGRFVGDEMGDVKIAIPSVARLVRPVSHRKRGVKFSRDNVFTRDGFRCQYCRVRFQRELLNYDHVLPRDAGGKTIWENIVTSCYPCNGRKANRTPEQAGMMLLRRPTKPKWLPASGPRIDHGLIPDEWVPFCQSFWSEISDAVA